MAFQITTVYLSKINKSSDYQLIRKIRMLIFRPSLFFPTKPKKMLGYFFLTLTSVLCFGAWLQGKLGWTYQSRVENASQFSWHRGSQYNITYPTIWNRSRKETSVWTIPDYVKIDKLLYTSYSYFPLLTRTRDERYDMREASVIWTGNHENTNFDSPCASIGVCSVFSGANCVHEVFQVNIMSHLSQFNNDRNWSFFAPSVKNIFQGDLINKTSSLYLHEDDLSAYLPDIRELMKSQSLSHEKTSSLKQLKVVTSLPREIMRQKRASGRFSTSHDKTSETSSFGNECERVCRPQLKHSTSRNESIVIGLYYFCKLITFLVLLYNVFPRGVFRQLTKKRNDDIASSIKINTHLFSFKWRLHSPGTTSLTKQHHQDHHQRSDTVTYRKSHYDSMSFLSECSLHNTNHWLRHPKTTTPKRQRLSWQPPQLGHRLGIRWQQVSPMWSFLPDATCDPDRDFAHVGYRLASLSALPSAVPTSRIKLANAGFYFRGQGDEVTCYSCRLRHSGWRVKDDPMTLHRALSPACEHVLRVDREASSVSGASGGERAAVPTPTPGDPGDEAGVTGGGGVGDSANVTLSLWQPGVTARGGGGGGGRSGEGERQEGGGATESSGPSLQSDNDSGPVSSSSDRADASSWSTSNVSQPERVTPLTPTTTTNATSLNTTTATTNNNSNPNTAVTPPATSSTTPPTSTSTTTSSAAANSAVEVLRRGTTSVPPESLGAGSSSGARVATEPRPFFPRPSLCLGDAVYPIFQDSETRRRTFVQWDESRAPHLDLLVMAGLFYAGYSDCLRCFFCGVGMRHWLVDDDPWVQHARWRPGCGYLLAVKGEAYVKSIQRAMANDVPDAENPSGAR